LSLLARYALHNSLKNLHNYPEKRAILAKCGQIADFCLCELCNI
jgi:hypothetical protein